MLWRNFHWRYYASDPVNDNLSEASYLKEENNLLRQMILNNDNIISDKATFIALWSKRITVAENNINMKTKQLSTSQPKHKTHDQDNSIQLSNDTNKDQTKNKQRSAKFVEKKNDSRTAKCCRHNVDLLYIIYMEISNWWQK